MRTLAKAIGQDNLPLLEQIIDRHPERVSPCGALLSEITSGEDTNSRANAADIFGLLKCRRGVKQLQKVIEHLTLRHETHGLTTQERYLQNHVLIALGKMDSRDAHKVLKRTLLNSKYPKVRSDALEAMAFEEEYFDFALVTPFLSSKAHPFEIVSALYAMEFQNYANLRPKDARRRLIQLLTHESPTIRAYTVNVLSFRDANRDLVLRLEKDPDLYVRETVAGALVFMTTH